MEKRQQAAALQSGFFWLLASGFWLFWFVGIAAPVNLAVNLVVSPSRPTVGDLITLTLPQDVERVLLAPESGVEVVQSDRNRLVLRSFRPGVLPLTGQLVRARGATQLRLNLTVHSVLKPDDSLEPAALRPPRPLPPNLAARWAIGLAAAIAFLSWLAVVLLARHRQSEPALGLVSPVEEFRSALAAAAATRDPNARLIKLAAATRIYLSRRDPNLSRELTTFELGRQLPERDATFTILELLAGADLAKFSPWGAEQRDYGRLAERIARIPDSFEPREAAA